MQITGTHFAYYQICERKVWLFANSIQMEHTSDLVAEGKLIHETTYPQRNSKYEEVAIGGIKVDYYDSKNRVIHEIKKSKKKETAHIWQLKHYIYIFEKHGINNVSGILEYPKIRKTQEVLLSNIDRENISQQLKEITEIITNNKCPNKLPVKKCSNCSYFDFCYATETNETKIEKEA